MEHKTDSLLFKFALIFLIFTTMAMLMSGISIYVNQTNQYKEQCEKNMQDLADYIESMLIADGKNFLVLQDYFMKHKGEMMICHDFSGDYDPAKKKYEELFAAQYPGKILGSTITFEELSPEVKNAYAVYYFEYWLYKFEKARDFFGLKYVYYIVPTAEPLHMVWMLDLVRDKKTINDVDYIDLGVDVYEPMEKHQKMWEAWNTGKKPKGYDTYDNEFGKTYAYYNPLYIDGRKVGLIGTEIDIDNVNKAILRNALQQTAIMGLILFLCVSVMLWAIHKRYISKLSHLQANVRDYADNKDSHIADAIEQDVTGKDEISALSMQVAAMIHELENYMKSLVETMKELGDTKKKAEAMNELAHKDALTGIRNKTAYDNEIRRIEWAIEDGKTNFGIAVIDLNFLKRINDTYGHEHGNIAIKKLCHMVCVVFAHSPVFRIGGDEFAVILKNDDLKNVNALVEKFNTSLDEMASDETQEPWERISAAIGIAMYDPIRDNNFTNVFKRADKAMYKRKKEMKAVRT